MKHIFKVLSLVLALTLALGAVQIGAYAALNDGTKLTAVVKLEIGRTAGGVFTPLKDGENIAKGQVITVRVVPKTDFLCGPSCFVVLVGRNAFSVVGSGDSIFTPNKSNTYYAKAASGYSGTELPDKALPEYKKVYGDSAGQAMYNAYKAVQTIFETSSNADNGGYPEYLPGTWLYSFNLKAIRDVTAGAGTKIVMDPRWVRTPERTGLKAYFFKCESRTQRSTTGSSTTYNFKLDFTGADFWLPRLAVPKNFKAASASYSSVKLTWASVTSATGYVVYRSASASSGYARIKVTRELSFTDTGRKTGTKYYYKVRAYKLVGSKAYYGTPSAAVSATPLPAVPGSFTATAQTGLSVKLNWSSVAGASGYVLYRRSNLTNTYSRLKVLTGTSWTDKDSLVKGRTYYYKVRAYRTVSAKTYYGAPSAARTVVAK